MDAALGSVNTSSIYGPMLLCLRDDSIELDGRSDKVDVRFENSWDAVLVTG